MRPGQPIESAVVAQPGDIGRAARLQPGEQPLLGEAGVQAHRCNLADRAFQAVDKVEDEIERALGGVRVAGPQPGIEQVARLRRAGDDRVVHALVIVPVPGRARLRAVHLDRQAVDVDSEIAQFMAATLGS